VSYVNMDHAGWVEKNNAAGKRLHRTARDVRKAAENKGFLAAPDELNPFQRRAIDILGIVGNGIYNAPISWETAYWSPQMIAVSWHHSLATWDFANLTRLVFLCHEARIRADIGPKGFRHIEVTLSQRSHEGAMSWRHPDLDEAVKDFRGYFHADHPVAYVMPSSVGQLPVQK
jgi:hypothetical protein